MGKRVETVVSKGTYRLTVLDGKLVGVEVWTERQDNGAYGHTIMRGDGWDQVLDAMKEDMDG